MDSTERWRPDDTLVFAVRTHTVPIATLAPLDRVWLVAELTLAGWTAATIAERLACSLRLVQQIKADNATQVAVYALGLRRRVLEEQSLRRLGDRAHATEVRTLHQRIAALISSRDVMLDAVRRMRIGVGA